MTMGCFFRFRSIGHHDQLAEAGDLVHLFGQGDALFHVLEVDDTGDFRQDRERVRVPFEQYFVRLHRRAIFELDVRAVDDLVALAFPALLVDHGDDAAAIHGDDLVLQVPGRIDADVLYEAGRPGFLRVLFRGTRRRAADVERTHRELGTRFADRLGGNHAYRFATLDQPSRGQVAAVAELADAALRFAGQHRTDLDALDTGRLNLARQRFRDLLVHVTISLPS
jgi:hypothetical protein